MKKLILMLFILTTTSAFSKNIATVDGIPITQNSMEQFIELLVAQGAKESDQLREQVKQELINRQILLREAEKLGIHKREDTQTEIDLAKNSIIIRTLLNEYIKKHPISSTNIKNEYDKLKKEQSTKKEFRLSHILVDTEKYANELLNIIKTDANKFNDIAKANSKDVASAVNGGDLGWGSLENYVKSFSDSIKDINVGEIVQKPIKTQFGWHIIQLNDVRAVEFPELDQVKPQIEEILKQQLILEYQRDLRSKSKIEM
ncbi:peptidyl-prolyl cis-trans isomerase C [Candidatus Kinetoplastibacterium blastocrithidii TCC012E]|uniref:peptidylprolyl isomerase n=1 Tax=Candidatus Kinetoplastidibacterium blastocrithidiae TCC012E TaxID=1208922 RepID=M1MDV7_9PROT|nr:peptidylprolyl isomerase [Candidatus Kinetoplastibacterium blastocrithidii]AFZ83785.1 peptidyl-prolyl cis-trans isomerase C [Candidatus Kinetoplastibacterium blastocrithidii (ex Strigomonas culicis)]AGF49910.1 peptidyl-prolyl cis-trans isomerase C [Candidatus Kinetoplastibacterium blastocrithidii TCC012E]